jgi:phospho-N-acetylmuramoyl-pentapeptide-transferase
MLYYLLYERLQPYISPLRVFRYTTFRTAFASLTALFLCIALGPWLINKLRQFQIGQYIREEGPKSHQKKAGTPTMGGVLIIISIVIPTLLWADLRYPYVWIAIAALVGYGWIGFLDDYAKVTRHRNLGLSGGASWCTSSRWGSHSPRVCW